jgi:hypothetical protein
VPHSYLTVTRLLSSTRHRSPWSDWIGSRVASFLPWSAMPRVPDRVSPSTDANGSLKLQRLVPAPPPFRRLLSRTSSCHDTCIWLKINLITPYLISLASSRSPARYLHREHLVEHGYSLLSTYIFIRTAMPQLAGAVVTVEHSSRAYSYRPGTWVRACFPARPG